MEDLNPTNGEETQVLQPDRAVPKKYIPAILYLAERMASSDRNTVARERSVIDDIAEAVDLKNFRHAKDFKELTEDKACKALEIQLAQRAALVVMALVLKADDKRRPEEHDFFRRVREKLGAPPITVPVDLGAHRSLAFKYLVK